MSAEMKILVSKTTLTSPGSAPEVCFGENSLLFGYAAPVAIARDFARQQVF
jgi:hypothetical protein